MPRVSQACVVLVLKVKIRNPCILLALNNVLNIRKVVCAKGLKYVTGVSLESKKSESLHLLGYELYLKDKKSTLCQGADRSGRC